jgi:hypothetical protein
MPAIMCRIYFSFQEFFWTETYYRAGESLATALQFTVLLATGRAAILPAGVVIGQVRVANDPPDRQVLADGVWPNSGSNGICEVNDSVTVRFQAGPAGPAGNYWRSSNLRGIPHLLTAGSGGNAGLFNSQQRALFQGWLDQVVQLGFRLKVATKQQPWHTVSMIEDFALADCDASGNALDEDTLPEAAARLVVSLADGATLPLWDISTGKPSRCRLRGTSWFPGGDTQGGTLNGEYEILAGWPGAVAIKGKFPPGGKLAGYGFLKLTVADYVPITSCQIEAGSTHKTGGRTRYLGTLQPHTTRPGVYLPSTPGFSPEGFFTPGPQIPATPVYGTFRTSLDLVQEIQRGYIVYPGNVTTPIGIAQVLNYENLWLLFASGTTLSVAHATSIPEDIFSAFGVPDLYSLAIAQAVYATIPRGSRIAMAGLSLGGMEMQNVQKFLLLNGYSTGWLTTYGAPITTPLIGSCNRISFMLQGDLVPNLSPIGAALGTIGHPEQTLLQDPDIPTNPIDSHRGYNVCSLLENWDPFGYPIQGGTGYTMILGELKRFPAPAFPW